MCRGNLPAGDPVTPINVNSQSRMIMNELETSARGDAIDRGRQYLEATVQSAPPERLRLMLIERAVDVAGHLSLTWRSKQSLGSNEHSIMLLDLINELLAGIVGGNSEGENELCLKVADLYVFLAKHLVAAEGTSDADAIDEIRGVLEVEAETWRAVCARASATPRPSVPGNSGLNLQA
jgi:flagellar protein FliS